MKKQKRRLGRGLDSLLSSTQIKEIDSAAKLPPEASVPSEPVQVPAVKVEAPTVREGEETVTKIPVDKVQVNPHQPRRHWNEEKLEHLAESIRANGLIQPIIVREMGDGYQLIAGERRLRATMKSGEEMIMAVVRQATEQQIVEWALVENIHRDDLDAIERAHAYRHYIEHFSLTQEQAAEKLGESRTTLANYMRLLELPPDVRELLSGGQLTMGHARALLGFKDGRAISKAAVEIIEKSLSVRDVEKMVKACQEGRGESKPAKTDARKPHILELEEEMSRSLGTKVFIKPSGKRGHRGKIVIDFYSLDDFDRIRERLQ